MSDKVLKYMFLFLGLAFLAIAVSGCTSARFSVHKPDGTVVDGSYISTKDQSAPFFNYSRTEDSVDVSTGAESTNGVDREAVINLLGSLLVPTP